MEAKMENNTSDTGKTEARKLPLLARPIPGVILLLALYMITGVALSTYVGDGDDKIASYLMDAIMIAASGTMLYFYPYAFGSYRPLKVKKPSLAAEAVGWVILFAITWALSQVLALTTSALVSGQSYSVYSPGAIPSTGAILLSLVVAPICEEMVFRGVIFKRLSFIMPVSAAALISSVVFAFLHGSLSMFPTTLLMGLFFCAIYARTEKLWISMAAHSINNATLYLLPMLSGRFTLSASPEIIIACGIVLAVLLTWLPSMRERASAGVRNDSRLHPLMKSSKTS